jgi:hypothetical protein
MHVNYVVASCSEIPVVTKFECVPYSGSGYGYVHTWEHQRMMYIKMVMVTVPDINRNLSGKWYGYGNSTCSAWLSYEGCTEEEKVKKQVCTYPSL